MQIRQAPGKIRLAGMRLLRVLFRNLSVAGKSSALRLDDALGAQFRRTVDESAAR